MQLIILYIDRNIPRRYNNLEFVNIKLYKASNRITLKTFAELKTQKYIYHKSFRTL